MSTDDNRWRAVVSRDKSADGAFFYAVATTGVYCRPSCGARAPRRENVTFHATQADAVRAGFRACLRCKPDAPALDARRAEIVAGLCRLIEESDEALELDALAAHAGLSPSHVHRLFKAVTGVTPRVYARSVRGARVRAALVAEKTVTLALHDAGFGSSGRFYEQSRQLLGMAPRRFLRGGEGVDVRFAVGATSLGAILVAATNEGVCAITLGDDPQALVHDLERRFPRARLHGGDAAFEELVARVVGLVERPARAVDLPLDLRGTAFQMRVWKALGEIPVGDTATYTEIARRLGSPASVRAVAGACAKNPVAVAVPCHRVVRTDGELAGYRWGVERKRALLARESGP